ncbi:MAG: hypothetical protein IE909_08100 [Campylobacterales bacterium]|nr:hypothetical protein [Campylobacterales bacterium]
MFKNRLFGILFVAVSVFASDVVEQKSNGFINWSEGVAVAKGMGFAKDSFNPLLTQRKAQQAAKLDAMRNLLEIVGNVKLNASTTIKDKMIADETVKTSINGLITNIVDVQYTTLDKNSVEAQLKIKLDSQLFPLSIPNDTKKMFEFKGTKGSGLIVDATTVDFIPTMNPKIIQEYEGVLYPDNVLQVDNIKGRFSVVYLNNLEDAKTHPLMGSYPLVVKAKSLVKGANDQVVLDKKSALMVQQQLQQDALENGKVIIVIK